MVPSNYAGGHHNRDRQADVRKPDCEADQSLFWTNVFDCDLKCCLQTAGCFGSKRTSPQSATSVNRFPAYKKRETRLFGVASNVASTDSMLVAAIRSGDGRAMAQLYERYSSTVYSVALRVLGDAAAAEDILQEVFMQLWRNADVFNPDRGSLPGWLAVMTRNRAIDSLRKRRPESDITQTVVAIEPDLAGKVDWARALEKVRGVLEGMPAPQRLALEMAFFDGLTHIEIAEKTGHPLGTIKTRIRTGLADLRKAFNQ